MASRAIYLEIATSLTTDSFLNAYRRFVCRRGPIQQLRSDQGTNFVGAKNEQEAALHEMDHNKIQRELLKDNCDWFAWKMNVPHASHMGGVWERQIKTVRSVLTGLLENHRNQLDDESLRTLMIEAEAIVNSRPLTTDDLTDPDSLDVLTPNHLLTMKSSVILAPPGNFLKSRCLLQETLALSAATSRRILAALEKELPTVPPDPTEVDHAYEER